MTVKNLDGRQSPRAAYIAIAVADFVAAGGVITLKAPPNSEITQGHINVTEAFDGVTTDTITVGDTADADRYLAATNLKVLGRTNVVPTGFVMGDDSGSTQSLTLTRATTGGAANAVGEVRVYLEYAQLGRSCATQD